MTGLIRALSDWLLLPMYTPLLQLFLRHVLASYVVSLEVVRSTSWSVAGKPLAKVRG